MKDTPYLLVAKIGRLVGVRGDLKIHIVSDFPSIFVPKATFHTHSLGTLCIQSFDCIKNLIRFENYTSRESAARLVNCGIYSTFEESKAMCELQEGEFLWQEMIGVSVCDKGDTSDMNLGVITDIERIGTLDYLLVSTDIALIQRGYKKQFLIPNIPHFVLSLSPEGIFTRNALAILEQS